MKKVILIADPELSKKFMSEFNVSLYISLSYIYEDPKTGINLFRWDDDKWNTILRTSESYLIKRIVSFLDSVRLDDNHSFIFIRESSDGTIAMDRHVEGTLYEHDMPHIEIAGKPDAKVNDVIFYNDMLSVMDSLAAEQEVIENA